MAKKDEFIEITVNWVEDEDGVRYMPIQAFIEMLEGGYDIKHLIEELRKGLKA